MRQGGKLEVFAFAMFVCPAWAGLDFHCMQTCLGQGYARSYCQAICSTRDGTGSRSESPGLPRNPAFEEIQVPKSQQPPARRVDSQCMKECLRRGHDYMFCYQRVCSYPALDAPQR